MATIDRLTEMIVSDLERRQDELNAPEANRIGTQLISKGAKGGPDFGARDRMRLAIVAVGFGMSCAAAYFLEGLSELWRRRKHRRAAKNAVLEQRGLPSGETSVDRVTTIAVASFDDLYSSESSRLVDTLHFMTGDEVVALDIATETFERASEVWPVPTRAHPIVWLYGEAVGRAWTAPPAQLSEPHPDGDELWTAVLALPAETRAVLALSYIAELSDKHIADGLTLDLHTVEAHRLRGARHVRSASEAGDTTGTNGDDIDGDETSETTPTKPNASGSESDSAESTSKPIDLRPDQPGTTNGNEAETVSTSSKERSRKRAKRDARTRNALDNQAGEGASTLPIADTPARPKAEG